MKRGLLAMAALGLIPLLAACGPTPASPPVELTEEPSDTPVAVVASPTATSTVMPTQTPVVEEIEESTPEIEVAFPTPHPNPECVEAPIPEDPNIVPVTADDWSKGPDDALVTLVEYSDFQ